MKKTTPQGRLSKGKTELYIRAKMKERGHTFLKINYKLEQRSSALPHQHKRKESRVTYNVKED